MTRPKDKAAGHSDGEESRICRAFLNAAEQPMIALAMDGAIRFWNHAAEQNYGWAGNQALGKNAHQLLRTRFPIPLSEIKKQLQNTGRWEGELAHEARDGRLLPVESLWVTPAGNRAAIFEVDSDLSRERGAEERLRESEARFRAIFESAATGIAMLSLDGRFLAVNPRYAEIAGRSPEDLLSLRFRDITHPDDLQKNVQLFERLAAGGIADYTLDKRCIRPDGQAAWLRLRTSVVTDASGKPKSAIAVVNDVTEQVDREERLRRALDTIRQLSTPVLRIGSAILLLPLIGTLDRERVQNLTSQLLAAIRQERARAAVLDLTGVAEIDASLASHFVDMHEASRLLGCRLILTGISRGIAARMATLNIPFGKITSRVDLQGGIEEARLLVERVHPVLARG